MPRHLLGRDSSQHLVGDGDLARAVAPEGVRVARRRQLGGGDDRDRDGRELGPVRHGREELGPAASAVTAVREGIRDANRDAGTVRGHVGAADERRVGGSPRRCLWRRPADPCRPSTRAESWDEPSSCCAALRRPRGRRARARRERRHGQDGVGGSTAASGAAGASGGEGPFLRRPLARIGSVHLERERHLDRFALEGDADRPARDLALRGLRQRELAGRDARCRPCRLPAGPSCRRARRT